METRNPCSWSELPHDLLESIFKRLSFMDFHRAKIVCSNWSSSSKLTVPPKVKSPWLMLFPEEDNEEDNDGCVQLYNPEEDKIYKTKRDFSGIRFLGNWGSWFLAIDSRFNLYIIDLFSENLINLPPLESLQSSDNRLYHTRYFTTLIAYDLKGLLWVDEKTQDYIVVWFFEFDNSVCFCKKGDDHYTYIRVFTSPENVYDVVLRGNNLYILSNRDKIRFIDLSGFQIFSWGKRSDTDMPFLDYNLDNSPIVVINTSGEALLLVHSDETTTVGRDRTFRVFKKYYNEFDFLGYEYFEVDSLGDESLLLGSRICVPDIEPNSIYITGHDGVYHVDKPFKTKNICVFNFVTKTSKRFPSLPKMKLKDSRWFLPGI